MIHIVRRRKDESGRGVESSGINAESSEARPRVGVIGLGKVGSAVRTVMSYWFDCVGYDIRGEHSWTEVTKADIVFVCVPSPESEAGGRLDCSIVDDVLARLSKGDYRGLVVIKSTVGIGYMDNATKRFPQLRLVYMPEFLRERSSLVWFANPDRIVVSGEPKDVEEALSYFRWVEDVPILRMDHRSAEIGKLAHNAYIATKVSFTNEIEMICDEIGGDPQKVMSVIWADRRVKSQEHLRPLMGPYGGKCVPKDLRELLNSTSRAVLLSAVEEVNRETQRRYGREEH